MWVNQLSVCPPQYTWTPLFPLTSCGGQTTTSSWGATWKWSNVHCYVCPSIGTFQVRPWFTNSARRVVGVVDDLLQVQNLHVRVCCLTFHLHRVRWADDVHVCRLGLHQSSPIWVLSTVGALLMLGCLEIRSHKSLIVNRILTVHRMQWKKYVLVSDQLYNWMFSVQKWKFNPQMSILDCWGSFNSKLDDAILLFCKTKEKTHHGNSRFLAISRCPYPAENYHINIYILGDNSSYSHLANIVAVCWWNHDHFPWFFPCKFKIFDSVKSNVVTPTWEERHSTSMSSKKSSLFQRAKPWEPEGNSQWWLSMYL